MSRNTVTFQQKVCEQKCQPLLLINHDYFGLKEKAMLSQREYHVFKQAISVTASLKFIRQQEPEKEYHHFSIQDHK